MRRPCEPQRSTSSGGQASPPRLSVWMRGSVRSIVDSTVGTACMNVMRFSSRKSARPVPTLRPSVGPAMSAAPVAQVVQSSSIEKSNETDMPW